MIYTITFIRRSRASFLQPHHYISQCSIHWHTNSYKSGASLYQPSGINSNIVKFRFSPSPIFIDLNNSAMIGNYINLPITFNFSTIEVIFVYAPQYTGHDFVHSIHQPRCCQTGLLGGKQHLPTHFWSRVDLWYWQHFLDCSNYKRLKYTRNSILLSLVIARIV